ncbi:MAG: alpha-L-glutamate ligase [Gammaproteobacteria bacterium]|nr:alpha-L-glutamate ligase [Gammaproteobacteria bacterium]
MSHIHIIHENEEWTAPLLRELHALGHPYKEWHLGSGRLGLDEIPPAGVFYSRMSASSHTRDHRYAPELTGGILAWLEAGGARVLNGTRALALELSKMAQYAALRQHGIRVPRTVAALGREQIIAAACDFETDFISKHNRAGKGLGVRLHENVDALVDYLDGPEFALSVDGITLIQEYIEAPTPHITRVEFIGQEFLYALRVDTSEGFELCPAQSCEAGDAACPVGEDAAEKFVIVDNFDHPLLDAYRGFMVSHELQVAAFEFIVDGDGRSYTYDINTNTNYNPSAEARAGRFGMPALARLLGVELARQNMINEAGHDHFRARLSVASR